MKVFLKKKSICLLNTNIVLMSIAILFMSCSIYKFSSYNLSSEVESFNITVPADTASSESNSITNNVKNKLDSKLKNTGLVYREDGDISFSISLTKFNVDKKGDIYELQASIAIEYKNLEQKIQKLNLQKNKQLPQGTSFASESIISEFSNEIVEDIWNQTLGSW